ncbi:MAG: SagB/ThcOx family dehydrogenase [Desulfosudaceae bacterium]
MKIKPGQAILLWAIIIALGLVWLMTGQEGDAMDKTPDQQTIKLPRPGMGLKEVTLDEALAGRRSLRRFSPDPLTLSQISSLLWSGQGITDERGWRTAPSAGALYPLEIYAITRKKSDLPAGIYHYVPRHHHLKMVKKGDFRPELARAGLGQPAIQEAPLTFVITAVFERTTAKYGNRGRRYVFMETGHAGQNILLAAAANDLGAVPIGAFDDHQVSRIMDLEKEQPLYLIPVGHPAE